MLPSALYVRAPSEYRPDLGVRKGDAKFVPRTVVIFFPHQQQAQVVVRIDHQLAHFMAVGVVVVHAPSSWLDRELLGGRFRLADHGAVALLGFLHS